MTGQAKKSEVEARKCEVEARKSEVEARRDGDGVKRWMDTMSLSI